MFYGGAWEVTNIVERVGLNTETKAYIRVYKDRIGGDTIDGFKQWLVGNPMTVQYALATELVERLPLTNSYNFPPVKGQSVAVNGTISTTIGSITVPTESLSFTLNPNLEAGQQFVAPEFSVSNDSHAPITLGVSNLLLPPALILFEA